MSLERIEQRVELAPRQIIAQAEEQATLLMEIVQRKTLYATIEGKQYLEAEAWETILAFNRVVPDTDWVEPIREDGEIVGYNAKVSLWKYGERTGGAIMSCGLDEFPCRGKEGQAKHKAAKSAAQTWALSKAARMQYSYIVVLAGYQPTPAEEMRSETDKASPYYCEEHDTMWFKKGRMPAPAHKIDGTSNWCNMPRKKKESPAEAPVDQAPPLTVNTFWELTTTQGWTTEQVVGWLGVESIGAYRNKYPDLTWDDIFAQLYHASQNEAGQEAGVADAI